MEPKMTAKDASEFLGISLQAINKSLKTKGLDFKKSANRLYFGHETSRKLFDLPVEPRTVAFQIVKGGVGKTALAFNFAVRASLYGLKVLCVDLDQQGNLTDLLGVDGEEQASMLDCIADNDIKFEDLIVSVIPGIDVVPSNLDNAILENTILLKKSNLARLFKTRFASVKNDYDVIVIDCPPALGSVNTAAALASDLVIGPVDPDRHALKGLKYSYQEIKKMAEEHGCSIETRVLINKFDKRTSLSHDTLEKLIKHDVFGPLLYKSYIGVSQQITNANASGKTVFDQVRETSAKVDLDLMTREILGLDQLLEEKKLKNKASKPSQAAPGARAHA